ncbi:MAG TPA: hypothetical protein ENK66_05565 [Arcobacter sp.]|nr:hypothetical protein [Arcobacter sp.]
MALYKNNYPNVYQSVFTFNYKYKKESTEKALEEEREKKQDITKALEEEREKKQDITKALEEERGKKQDIAKALEKQKIITKNTQNKLKQFEVISLSESILKKKILFNSKQISILKQQYRNHHCHLNMTKKIAKQHIVNLGKAWAANTINTVIFRHHGIVTRENYQYTAFYLNEQTIKIIRRDLIDSKKLDIYELNGSYNLNDAHNSISLGVDQKGYIHISYDHHGSKLHYRKSLKPFEISQWTDELAMTNQNEENVTYPTFISPSETSPLMLMYRSGIWKKGSTFLKYYDEALEKWFDYPKPILSGSHQQPWTSNAYWNHPVIDSYGCLHLSYCWRTDYLDDNQLINNMNINYAKSYDNGYSWLTSKNMNYKLPITQTISEVVWAIPSQSNLINQTSMAIDSLGNPHIVYYSNDKNGIPQLQHLWFNDEEWKRDFISERKEPFILSGGGTLELPISRPEILIDRDDNVYVIYRSKETDNKLILLYLNAPAYKFTEGDTIILYDEPVGQSEPIIDRDRWEKENILSLLVQYNLQPNGDMQTKEIFRDVKIVDIEFRDKGEE